jgi:hypothetical protein
MCIYCTKYSRFLQYCDSSNSVYYVFNNNENSEGRFICIRTIIEPINGANLRRTPLQSMCTLNWNKMFHCSLELKWVLLHCFSNVYCCGRCLNVCSLSGQFKQKSVQKNHQGWKWGRCRYTPATKVQSKIFLFTIHSFIHTFYSFIHQWLYKPIVGPWLLLQFRNLFHTDCRTSWTSDEAVTTSLPA